MKTMKTPTLPEGSPDPTEKRHGYSEGYIEDVSSSGAITSYP